MQQNTSRNITPRTNNPGKKCDKVQNTTNTTRSPTTRNITTRKINMGQITTRANTGGNKILQGTTLQKNHNTTKEQLTRNKSLQGTSVQGPTLQGTEYYMDQHYGYMKQNAI